MSAPPGIAGGKFFKQPKLPILIKHFLATVLLTGLGILQGSAQDTIRMYLNEDYEMANKKEKAVYIRESFYSKGIYYITDKHADGRNIVSGAYSSIVPRIEQGYFRYYNEVGNLYAEGSLNNGSLTGRWIYYNNLRQDTVNYGAVEKMPAGNSIGKASPALSVPVKDELIGYIQKNIHYPARVLDLPGDKVFSVTVVLRGNRYILSEIAESPHRDFNVEIGRLLLAAPESLLQTGMDTSAVAAMKMKVGFTFPAIIDTTATYNNVTKPASFQNGNEYKFITYVQKSIQIPPDALHVTIAKKATVQFRVRFDGKIDNISILRSCGIQTLDAAIVKEIENAPDWIPAKNGNVVVSQRFVMPIVIVP